MFTKFPHTGRRWRTPLTGVLLAAQLGLATPARSEPPPLTLAHATEAALSARPELAAWASDLEALEGRSLQASLKPNPELELETTNLIDEATVSVSQAFELGNKRQARVRLAEAERPVLAAEQERLRLDVAAEVARAFTDLLGAQEQLRLTHEGYELANELARTAAERVAAGAVSPIEETRARVALAGAAGDLERARGEVERARVALAAAMGAPTADFGPAAGTLGADLTVPDRAALEAALGQNVDLTRWRHETVLRGAAVKAEEASTALDVTFKGGLGYVRDPGEGLVLLSVSIPLAVRDRNQGAVREARAGLARVAHERRAEEARLRGDETSVTLQPGEGAKVKATMREGQQFVFQWATEGGAVNFDMHGERFNAGDAFTGHLKSTQQTADQGTFVAPFDGTHGWFWSNRGDQAVTVKVQVGGFHEKLAPAGRRSKSALAKSVDSRCGDPA